ncbi:MAG: Serine-tRNA ligase [candidate division TM6 bacterium GW2011_GWF2_37_49]|nr:MAG: Serine-tRNA ligase [candidate division TM6 bacterium GW2011_GWF2_37_49]
MLVNFITAFLEYAMIDLNRLRADTDLVKELILRKEPSFNVDRLLELDRLVRSINSEIEGLRKNKNELASAGSKGITPEIRQKSIELGKELKLKEDELCVIEQEYKTLWLSCPNIPAEDIPLGNKEANLPVRIIGQKPDFKFTIKNHVELNEKAKWFDFETAAKMSGAQFALYRGLGVKVIYALTRMMLKNNVKKGFEPIIPPYLVNEGALYNSGNLPKFKGDYYSLPEDGLNLIPTAEVSLTNIYADKILPVEELPLRMTAWTGCFRREAGTYGSTERGLIRIHQFEKVELYSICEPEKSFPELEMMVGCAEDILKMLGLHYRVSLLAAQDCSFSSAKTYDIEVWLPGQNQYYEVSSCSNCTDFQARRSKIRYRKTHDSKPELAHTLNASSLALPRLMVALMENYQQEDGSIKLPEALVKEMNEVW